MKHDHRTQKREPRRKDGVLHKLFAKPKRLPATAVHEQDWETDVPSIKLSTAFIVIVFLHVVVVGGVMLFRFMEKEADSLSAGYAAPSVRPEIGGLANRNPIPVAGGSVEDDPALRDLPRHRVRPHETLEMIASAYGVTAEAIARTNRLDESNQVRAGDALVIPPGMARPDGSAGTQGGSLAIAGADGQRVQAARPVADPSTAVRPARPVAAEPGVSLVAKTPASGGVSHVMKPGETLWAIAKRHGVSVDALLKANGITDARKVRDGTTLQVPAKNN